MAEAANTRIVQVTVPVADTSVIEWLDLQYSPSESLRRLVREAIAREGFLDVANRPVRPPANPVYVAESLPDEPDDESAEDDDYAPAPAAAPAPAPKTTRTRRASATAAAPAAKPAAKKAAAPAAKKAAAPAAKKSPAAEPPSVQPPADPAAPTIDDLLGL